MQLQPVKANLIYPSRVNRTLELSQQQDIIEVEPVLSRREVKRLPFIEANTKEVTIEHLKMIALYLCSARTMKSQSAIPTSLNLFGKQPTGYFPVSRLKLLKSG